MNRNGVTMDCDNHTGAEAVAECSICGKPVCGDCTVTVDGRQVCSDALHIRIARECIPLGFCSTVFDADLISKNLSANGIVNYYFDPLIVNGNNTVAMFVAAESIGMSRELVSSLDLNDFITMKTNGQ